MKVLIVTQYFWPENFRINDLCDALVDRGHEVTVYTGLPNYPEGKLYHGYSLLGPYSQIRNKVKIIRCPLIPRGKNKGIQLILNYLSFCLLSTFLAPLIVRGKFDKIFIYQLSPIFSALPAVLLKYIKNAPVIIWVTDLWPESLEATSVTKNKLVLSMVAIFVKFIYFHSDKIFISSRGFAASIKKLGVLESKIKYWPQWAENFYKNKTISTVIQDSIPPGFVFMFAGNIGTAQDFGTIVSAASMIKNIENIHFVILGDGLQKEWAVREVEARSLQNNFHFLGRKAVELMPAYFSRADVMLVSLEDTELFSITVPSKIQSYLASGKPILASLNGEGAEIIDKWRAGYTCPASSPHILAKTIEQMSKLSKSELDAMGKNAFLCYQSEFEREKLISILEQEFIALK